MIDRIVLLHFYSFSSMYLKAKEPWALGWSGERQKGWDVVGWMRIGRVWASVTPHQALIFQVWVQRYGERNGSEDLLLHTAFTQSMGNEMADETAALSKLF